MKKFGTIIAVLAGALLAAPALGQQPGQAYLGAAYGGVWTDGASPFFGTDDDKNSVGGKFYGGTMWNTFGMEFGLYSLGKYDSRFFGSTISQSKTMAVAVSGVYATDLGAGYTFHAKLGLAFTQYDFDCPVLCFETSTRKRGLAGLMGLGFGAKVAQDILLRLDFEHFGSVPQAGAGVEYKDGYDMMSVGLQFNF